MHASDEDGVTSTVLAIVGRFLAYWIGHCYDGLFLFLSDVMALAFVVRPC
ncbi:hypothetical protein [Synechococcus sp. MU1625]|nr:hypothetical protein [Synechococcus sp. MU1625]